MKKKKRAVWLRKLADAFFFWLLLYPAIIVLGWLFLGSLELFGAIRIRNKNLLPKWPRGLLVVSNHPSFWEPFALNYLFIRAASLNPIRFFPYGTPDFHNFNKWYWTTLKNRFIFFPRGDDRSCAAAHARAARLLKKGRIVIIFPEGGRTGTNKSNIWLQSPKGNRLRPLKSGAARLALQSKCDILPVWVRGADRVMPLGSKLPKFWRRTEIIVGESFRLEGEESRSYLKSANEEIANRLLSLSDQ